MNDELRQFVMDYLNGHNSEEELALKFDLTKCSECPSYELEEDLVYHKWDKEDLESQCCEDCRNNE